MQQSVRSGRKISWMMSHTEKVPPIYDNTLTIMIGSNFVCLNFPAIFITPTPVSNWNPVPLISLILCKTFQYKYADEIQVIFFPYQYFGVFDWLKGDFRSKQV